MSRIGKQPVPVPAGVKVAINPSLRKVDVTGPKGTLSFVHRPEVTVTWTESEKRIVCSIPESAMESGEARAYWGTTRAVLDNMIEGVTSGYEKTLEIQGVGYRAAAKGRDLELALGYSHPVSIIAPEGIEFDVPQPTEVVVRGIDKQKVGQIAANIRESRPPEPYKGKGIRYRGEHVVRKVGKRV